MQPCLTCLACSALLAAGGNAIAQRSMASVYTDISGKACARHVDNGSTGARTMDCPGVHGFRLQVLEDDERSSVSVVTPEQRVLPLSYWDVVTRGFSTLGAKAEWRAARVGGKAVPVALIVRVNAIAQSDPQRPKRVAFLAVAKIFPDEACVIRVVEALGPDANERARRFSDDGNMACLHAELDIKLPTKR